MTTEKLLEKLNKQIRRAEAAVTKAEENYRAALENLSKLEAERDEKRVGELAERIAKSGKSLEEIEAFFGR